MYLLYPLYTRSDTIMDPSGDCHNIKQQEKIRQANVRKRRLILGSQTILLLVIFEMYTNIKYLSTILSPTSISSTATMIKTKTTKNYVFGYGSLICPESRNITNPNLGRNAMPVVIRDLERVWSAHLKSGWTAVGVNFKAGAQTNGVLVEIPTQKELDDLDHRETGYDRKLIKLKKIQRIPYLPGAYDGYPHPVLLAKEQQQTSDSNNNEMDMVKVWVYIQKRQQFADPSYPIPQSYVDIVMRGCLAVGGKKFAKSFIGTTNGWHGRSTDSQKTNRTIDDDYYCWIDDRNDPIYRRSDRKYSNDNKHLIDRILNESIPAAYADRVEIHAYGK